MNNKITDLENKYNDLYSSKKELENKVNELQKKVNDLCLYKKEFGNKVDNLYKFKGEYEKYLKRKKEKEEKKEKEKENFLNKSDIIQENEIELIYSWLNKKPRNLNLLFSTKKDGDLISTFFKKVENKSPTLIVIKSSNNYRFGGYSSILWKCDNKWYDDTNSFIFSLDLKQKYGRINSSNIWGDAGLITFGNNIVIYDKCLSKDNWVGKCNYDSPDNYGMNGGQKYFKVLNFEVYEIIY